MRVAPNPTADSVVRAEPVSPAVTAAVSVAIPCYNYGRYLPDCLASVLSQEGVETTVLIVDDASTDDSAAVAQRLAAEHANVQLVVHESNRGHLATFNECIAWANGLAFVLISADDILAPGALRRAVDVLEQHPNVGMVIGDIAPFTGSPPVGRDTRPVDMEIVRGLSWVERRCVTGRNGAYSPEVVLRTEVQRTIGGHSLTLPHTSDFHTWLRAAAVSDVALVKGPPGAYYRRHGDNISQAFAEGATDFVARWDAFSEFFEGPWVPEPDRSRLWRRSRRGLADDALARANQLFDERGDNPDSQAQVDFAWRLDPSVLRRRAGLGYQARRAIGHGQPRVLPFMRPTRRVWRRLRRELGQADPRW
jgi:glycosyltransferase involved in cell wall biosynthesis